MSARSDKVVAEAKEVEDALRAAGQHEHANRIARLRKGYSVAVTTAKSLYAELHG